MIKVKICGITNIPDALLCSQVGADALGFIFTKKSPRYITPAAAGKIIKQLGPFVAKVGVFEDEEKTKVLDIASSAGLDVLQFHGSESAAYCRFFRPRFKVVKVFFPQASLSIKELRGFSVDAFLFDVRGEDKRRGARCLPPAVLKQITAVIEKGYRAVIAGGLDAKNVKPVIKLTPYAVDVAAGVEKSAGKKDEELVRRFIEQVKGTRQGR